MYHEVRKAHDTHALQSQPHSTGHMAHPSQSHTAHYRLMTADADVTCNVRPSKVRSQEQYQISTGARERAYWPRLAARLDNLFSITVHEGGCCHTSHSHNSLSQFTNVTPVSVCHSLLCEIPNDVKPGEAWATKKRASTPEVKKFKKRSRSPSVTLGP